MNRTSACCRITAAATLIVAACAAATGARAQAQQPPPQVEQQGQNSSVGGWTTNIAPSEPAPQGEPAAPARIEGGDAELLERISEYFNSIKHLEGRFLQINPDNERVKGKFYVRRPGLLRFDYARPSPLRVIADGEYLSIENHDLKTVDQYPLDRTPFRLLLSEDVDLAEDANILDLSRSDTVASVTLEDKMDGARGRLQLFFSLPDIELKEWVITDPQGLDTRIQLADLVTGKEVKKEFFSSTALELDNITGN